MRAANDFLKKLQEQFELANRPSGFPPKIFSVLYRWPPQPGMRSLRKLAHYKQGFPPIDGNKELSEVQQRNCWNVLANALLLEGYGNTDYPTFDPDNPAGDLFHLANNPSLMPPWHGAMLAAYHLKLSLLVMLLWWKGDMLAQQTEQQEAFYFQMESIRGESIDGRALMEGLQRGDVFSSQQLRAVAPFLDGAAELPGVSGQFQMYIGSIREKAEGMKAQWAQEEEMNASMAEMAPDDAEDSSPASASGAVNSAPASSGKASSAALAEVAIPRPTDPFLQMIVPSTTWMAAIHAIQERQYSRAAELLEIETRRQANPSRMQFVAYLLMARCWFDLGELQHMTPTLRLLWREVKKYGNRDLREDLVDDLHLFRWEPALLGELARLTLAYIANRDQDECEEISGYRYPLVQHLALSAGLSFLSSKGI